MRNFLLFTILPFIGFSQTQIGSDIDGESVNDYSGRSVSISADGNIVAIGAYGNDGNGIDSGHTRIYQNIAGIWTQIGQDINGEAAYDYSGRSVSLSSNGNIVAIGANGNDGNGSNSGHVRIYQNIAGVWTQIGQDINGESIDDNSGNKVCLSSNGNIVAIGAYGNNGNGEDSGHVRIYQNIVGIWTQIGQDINGEMAYDRSGDSVSLNSNGNIVAIGAYGNDGNGSVSGHVRIYQNIAGVWTQIGQDINGEAANDYSGRSVSLSSDGNIVAIGAESNDGNGIDSGHVRIYQNISDVWTQIGQDINGENTDDNSGISLSLSSNGNIVAIGANGNDGNGNNSGHVRIYQNIAGVWTQIGQDIDGETALSNSGSSVCLSSNGNIIAIGAATNSGNGTSSGHVRIFDLSAILNSNSFIQSNFKIYPNPTSETLTIELENNLILEKVNIYNTLGQVIKTESNTNINVSKLQKGTYFVEVITNQGNATKSIIVN